MNPHYELYYDILILALVQGITEFLPISSSAHLVLMGELLKGEAHNVLFDVALHGGTLLGVMVYMRQECARLLSGIYQLAKNARQSIKIIENPKDKSEDIVLLSFVFFASLPVILAGGLVYITGLIDDLRVPKIIAWASILFALPLWVADKTPNPKHNKPFHWRDGLIIGLFHILALIPGASRAGIAITAARFLGFPRIQAAKLSMLISIPVIFAFLCASLLELTLKQTSLMGSIALVGFLSSALFGFATIFVFLKLLERLSLTPFVLYRLCLGAGGLYYLYFIV